MNHDAIADVFSIMKNAEDMGKHEVTVPASKLIGNILTVLKLNGYIGDYEFMDDGKSGKFKVELKGLINDCNVIRPRFSVEKSGFKKWEKRFLPAEGVGLLVITTSQGVMSHEEAKKKHIGGQLLGFMY